MYVSLLMIWHNCQARFTDTWLFHPCLWIYIALLQIIIGRASNNNDDDSTNNSNNNGNGDNNVDQLASNRNTTSENSKTANWKKCWKIIFVPVLRWPNKSSKQWKSSTDIERKFLLKDPIDRIYTTRKMSIKT